MTTKCNSTIKSTTLTSKRLLKPAPMLAMAAALALALAPALAEARAGSGSNSGSRGSRTYQAPPATNTAPTAKPVERSTTQPSTTNTAPAQRPAQQPAAAPAQPQPQPSFFQRNPFMAGLMGGLVGAGIGGLLFGNGFNLGNAFSGGAGMLGLLLQIALIGGLGYLLYRMFARRNENAPMQGMQRESLATASGPAPRYDIGGQAGGQAAPAAMASAASSGDDVTISEADYGAFERALLDVQAAWSKGDLSALRRLVTPEMLGYFSDELAALASRGVENHVVEVKLEQGDLAEAWREGEVEFATVAMRFSALDYSVDTASNQVVEGNQNVRTEAVEVWTFMRASGGRWLLSAIQQAN